MQVIPNPPAKIFAGGIEQALDFVQIMVVQLLVDRLEYRSQVGKVHYPTGLIFNLPPDPNLNAEGMAVKTSTFVACRHVGQAVSRLTDEDFRDFYYTLLWGGRAHLLLGRRLFSY